MEVDTAGMDPAFQRWTALSDAYARQLRALRSGDDHARDELLRLSRELQRLAVPRSGLTRPGALR